ncbi:MAG: hypothetical protein SVU32_02000 [Candidatus Nanohaloarchaea archaeon]|nr:hypothetical protein [Candidatus Nanohaloarchaea archaeon]
MMRKHATLFLLAMAVLSVAAAAHAGHAGPRQVATGFNYSDKSLEQLKTLFNRNTDKLPGFLGSLIGGQRINIYIQVENESALTERQLEMLPKNRTLGVDMKGKKIQEFQPGGYEDPTLEIWVSVSDLKKLYRADNPFKKLSDMLKNGEIRYRAHGSGNKAKFFVVRVVNRVLSFFGIL